MSQIDYWLGQIQQTLRSVASEQHRQGDRIEHLSRRMDEALSWAQRLVLLGLTILGAIALNHSPEQIGAAVASIIKAMR